MTITRKITYAMLSFVISAFALIHVYSGTNHAQFRAMFSGIHAADLFNNVEYVAGMSYSSISTSLEKLFSKPSEEDLVKMYGTDFWNRPDFWEKEMEWRKQNEGRTVDNLITGQGN